MAEAAAARDIPPACPSEPNRDGRLTRAEYVDGGGFMTPQARAGIFGATDNNADGVMTRVEYVLNRIITDEAKAIVGRTDADKNGKVTRAEFVKDSPLKDRTLAGAVYDALDTNGDKTIAIPEYLRVWGGWARPNYQAQEAALAVRLAKLGQKSGAPKAGAKGGKPAGGPPNVVTYRTPIAASGAPDFTVKADGKNVFVNHARVAAYAIFSCDGPVSLEITWLGPIASAVVRPLNLGIKPKVAGHKITFTLPQPANLSVELNGNIKRPLFVFANPLETNVPRRGAPGVSYYGAGQIHHPGLVRLKSGDTVYIAGGAIVRGAFIAENAKDITIGGRGILDGSGYHKGERRMIEMLSCTNLRIQDIVIFNSGHWTVPLFKCDSVKITNLKIVNWRDWDDGIDVCGSSNVIIDSCFIRTKDDCIAIKSVHYDWMTGDGLGEVKNVTVQNSVLWNGSWGNGFEIGFETLLGCARGEGDRTGDKPA